jgi:hypothetical protein
VVSATLVACAPEISSPGKSNDALQEAPDGKIPPHTSRNPFDIPLSEAELQKREAIATELRQQMQTDIYNNAVATLAANSRLSSGKSGSAVLNSAPNEVIPAQPSQQVPDVTIAAAPQSTLPSQPQRVSQNSPAPESPPAPDDASSQPASTASPAVMATATKNLANGFHDYETTKKVADDAPFEIVRNTWDPTTLTLTALDTKVVYHEIVINRGNCSAYISNTDINYKITYDKLHDFYFGKYGDHILIQALNSREPHLSYAEQSSARVCEVLEVELRTSEGVSKYSFIQ